MGTKAISGQKAKDLCLELLYSQTEADTIGILQKHGLWDDRSAWTPYGAMPNNRGVVGNQQAHPVAALVEKLVNSVDTVLLAECAQRGIDPRSSLAPQSMPEALEAYFGVPEGRLRSLNPVPKYLADHIALVVSGSKSEPNYAVVDDGEGQQPDRFPATFLSLLRENKVAIPFVQGKYNMGGTGVLQFAGENSFQLIISRRRPDLPVEEDSDPDQHGQWGFTLVRRQRPGPTDPQSIYVYLAPEGVVPHFEAESMPLKPGPYPTAFEQPVEWGTCIKLWNYKIGPGLKSLATLDLRYALERFLQEPGLPVRIYERRAGYTAHTLDTSMSGLAVVLANAGDDKEPGLDTGSPLNVQGVGTADLEIAVITEEADKTEKRYPAGVFFNVNGQLHGQLGPEFFKRRGLKLDYVADTLIVRVDCTGFDTAIREDLFMPSRDRMREIPERSVLEKQIEEYLAEHQGLGELNARRRQKMLSAGVDEDTATVLQELVRGDPALAALFGAGDKIKVPGGPLPEPQPYEGKRFPTYFRLAKEPKGGLVRRSPRNWTVHVEYETDAANDYFSTARPDRGELKISGSPNLKSVHLWNGKAIVRLEIPAASSPGDVMKVFVTVMDESRIEPFESSFTIEVQDEQPHHQGGTTPPPAGATIAGIPNPIEVRQPQWQKFGFDQYSGVDVRHGDTDGSLDVYINMDNQYLRNERIRRAKSLGEGVVDTWFKYGLLILSLGILFRQRQNQVSGGNDDSQDDEKSGDVAEFDQIRVASTGLAVTVIPLIAQMMKKAKAS